MTPRDMALAALTSVIWGLAFVFVKFGLVLCHGLIVG